MKLYILLSTKIMMIPPTLKSLMDSAIIMVLNGSGLMASMWLLSAYSKKDYPSNVYTGSCKTSANTSNRTAGEVCRSWLIKTGIIMSFRALLRRGQFLRWFWPWSILKPIKIEWFLKYYKQIFLLYFIIFCWYRGWGPEKTFLLKIRSYHQEFFFESHNIIEPSLIKDE